MTMPAVQKIAAAGERTHGGEDLIVEVVTLAELFSGDHRFRLPPFQRAYAWQTSHVGRLLADIRDAMEAGPQGGGYLLGLLTLVERPGSHAAAIIDGHQRIVTLTILFAVLRDLEVDPLVKERLSAAITMPSRDRTKPVEYVLEPQAIITDFMAELVQKPGATLRDPEVGEAELSETERNILENRDYLCAALGDSEIDQDERRELSMFLADHCRVILRIMRDEVEAWRTLEVEDTTRVDFNASSRSKASILAALPQSERDHCGRLWDQCEHLLCAEDMYKLLGFVRTLKLRQVSKRPIETDLWEGFDLANSSVVFFERELVPTARLLRAVRDGAVGEGPARARIRERLARLDWVRLDFWIPVALHWLTARGEQDGELEPFFAALERLAWVARIANLEPPKLEKRVLAILTHIDRSRPVARIPELAVEAKLWQEALANLRSPNFRQKSYSALVLRRISVALGEDCGAYDREGSTFEHIVPRNPERDRSWTKIFKGKKQSDEHINRLGNLTFLTRDENNRAGNADWDKKREIYRTSRHILSRHAARREEWSAAAIDERTEELIGLLRQAWDMKG